MLLSAGRGLGEMVWRVALGIVAVVLSFATCASTFGVDGIAIPPIYIHGATSTPSKLIRQADGKVLVVGTGAGPVNWTMFAARFTSAGTLDASYGAAGIAYVPVPSFATSLSAQDATLDGQGNLLISGALNDGSYFGSTVVARLTASGSPDATFGSEGVREIVFANPDPGSRASSIAVDSQGRIVVLASSEDPNAVPPVMVARLNTDGSLDTTFNGTGIFRFGPYRAQAGSVAVDSGDNILITALDFLAPNAPVFVAKLTAAGQFDSSFNGSGLVYLVLGNYNIRFPVVVDADSRILVASESSYAFNHQTFQVTRLTASGLVDASFGVSGIASVALDGLISDALLTSMALDSLGRIIIAAHGTNPQTNGDGLFAARFLDTGVIDTSFNGTGIQSVPITPYTGWVVAALAIGADNSVVLAGSQGSASSGSIDVLVGRLTSAGAVDTTFNGTGVVAQNCGVKQVTVTSLALQRDGKLVLSGYTGDSWALPDDKIIVARLNASGVLDPSFNGTGFEAVFSAPSIERNRNSVVAIDSSDNIVLGSANQAGDLVVARLTPTGAPDTTFNGSGFNTVAGFVAGWSVVSGLAIDASGNIVLAGVGYAPSAGPSLFGAVRLRSTGTLDATFGSGGVAQVPIANPNGINDLVGVGIDSAGRIVLGGTTEDAFSQPNGMVVRLTSAGVLDPTFAGTGVLAVPPPAGSYSVESTALALDASDRILLAGIDRGSPLLTRLTPTGEFDVAFNGSGRFSYHFLDPWLAHVMAIDNAGRILLAGDVAGLYLTGEMLGLRLLSTGNLDPAFNGGEGLRVTAIPGPHLHRANALVLDAAGGIYVGGSVDRAPTIVKLFDSVPVELAFVSINGGTYLTPYQPFDVVVQARDDTGNAQPVSNATTVQISVANGSGTLIGTPTCLIPVGGTTCRIVGLMYSKAESYVILAAAVTAGDILSSASSAPFSVYVTQSTTVLSADVNPAAQGQTVTWTATVTGSSPTGSVQFYDGYGLCGYAALTGTGNVKTATCSSAGLPVGKTQISALYSGDANNFNSGGVLFQIVNSVANTNVALASTGAQAIASSTFSTLYPVSAINDGDRAGRNFANGGVWRDATQRIFPDWVQINLKGAQTIDHVIVYSIQDDKLNPVEPTDTLTFTKHGITAFEVQALVGFQWVSLGSVTLNNLVKRTVTFAPTTTGSIRILINAAMGGSYSYLAEVEAWTPGPPPPPPTPVTVTSSRNPGRVGANVVLTSTVTGNNPTGSVAFNSNNSTIAGCAAIPLAGSGTSKTAACTTSFASAGTYSIVANYGGDAANPAAASAPLSEVIKKR